MRVDVVNDIEALKTYLMGESYEPGEVTAILTVPGESLQPMLDSKSLKQLSSQTDLKPRSIGKAEHYQDMVEPILRLSNIRKPDVVAATEDKQADTLAPLNKLLGEKGPVVIALRKGFDDEVVKAIQSSDRKVKVIGHEMGQLRGLNGSRVDVDAIYSDVVLPKNSLIVAPGGIYPEKAKARQAEQPGWVNEQAELDEARVSWLLDHWKKGATLMTVGFDSLRVARDPIFKGKKFACSDQAVWSFPKKTAGAYTKSDVAETDERLISVKSARVLKDAEGL